MTFLLTPTFISLLATLGIMALLYPVAIYAGLVDIPSGRKQHEGNIPLIGGPAICLSTIVCMLVLTPTWEQQIYLVAAAAISMLGTLDDRFDIKPLTKLVGQIAISIFFITIADIKIHQLGDIFGIGNVNMGIFSVAFTVACTLGVINSINMIDGTDGLAGSIVLMSILAMLFLAHAAGLSSEVLPLMVVSGALIAFLLLNSRLILSKAKVFLGDSGSMLLGLTLVWFFIKLTQGVEPAFSAVTAGWLFGLPLMDTISVIVHRLRLGLSPFNADRRHIHHTLLDAGISTSRTTAIILMAHGCFIAVGIAMASLQVPETIVFWLFVIIVMVHHFTTQTLIKRQVSPTAS